MCSSEAGFCLLWEDGIELCFLNVNNKSCLDEQEEENSKQWRILDETNPGIFLIFFLNILALHPKGGDFDEWY